jgi:hypothetical protein
MEAARTCSSVNLRDEDDDPLVGTGACEFRV